MLLGVCTAGELFTFANTPHVSVDATRAAARESRARASAVSPSGLVRADRPSRAAQRAHSSFANVALSIAVSRKSDLVEAGGSRPSQHARSPQQVRKTTGSLAECNKQAHEA
jgi:hypothetical protein